jgi:Tol biopolymer transport system component
LHGARRDLVRRVLSPERSADCQPTIDPTFFVRRHPLRDGDGRAGFRESPSSRRSAILKEEPRDLSEGSARIQPGLARVIGHCLEKDLAERFQSARDIAFHLDTLSGASATEPAGPIVVPTRTVRTSWLPVALAALATLLVGFGLGRLRTTDPSTPTVGVYRLTDLAGLEETPAISPDGKSVAFTAYVGHRRQVWVKLIAGGAALQLTRDDVDHEAPRWAPDGASLVYYRPPSEGESQGTLWEMPALGGSPRRVASSIGSADISHDGTRLAFFRFEQDQIQLVVSSRDGSTAPRVIARLPLGSYYLSPRWSPDNSSIAYQSGYVFTHDIFAVPADGGEPRQISREGRLLSGFCWTADGSGIVYSSARGSTVLYLPTFNLWTARLDGSQVRQLTFGEVSYVTPDLDANGLLVASRITRSLNIWKFPVDGDALDNVRRGVQITRQTGQVQTPSVGKSDRDVVYSRTAEVTETCGSSTRRQARPGRSHTTESDVMLNTVWSPDGRQSRSTRRARASAGTGS